MCEKIIQFGKRENKPSATNIERKRNLNDDFSDIDIQKLTQWAEKVQDDYAYGAIKPLSKTTEFGKYPFDHVNLTKAEVDNKSDAIVFSNNRINMVTIFADQIRAISSSPNKEDPNLCNIDITMADSINIRIELYYSGV